MTVKSMISERGGMIIAKQLPASSDYDEAGGQEGWASSAPPLLPAAWVKRSDLQALHQQDARITAAPSLVDASEPLYTDAQLAGLRKSLNAAKLIIRSNEALLREARQRCARYDEAIQSLDSEREANARLTDEYESALRTQDTLLSLIEAGPRADVAKSLSVETQDNFYPLENTMRREHRYLVVKVTDAKGYLSEPDVEQLDSILNKIGLGRTRDGKEPLDCVVVERDWPEYEPTWAAIAARVDGGASSVRTEPAFESGNAAISCGQPATPAQETQ